MGVNVHKTYQGERRIGGREIENVDLIVEPTECSFKPNQPQMTSVNLK